jgi:outer membrane protein OmpA-like peptidoglycan-associated protein
MRRRLSIPGLVLGATALVAGCATKGFVRETVQSSEAKLTQDVGRLESDLGKERSRLTDVSTQVTEVRTTATEAGQRAGQAAESAGQAMTAAEAAAGKAGQAQARADEAAGQAGAALAKAEATDGRLTRLWDSRHKRTLAESVVVVFGFNQWQLDDRAQTVLLDVARQLNENPNVIVNVEGYTDNTGPEVYNVLLSQRRADAVRRFLVEKGVDLHRIAYVGLGDRQPVADNKTPAGRSQNRRVALKLYAPAD